MLELEGKSLAAAEEVEVERLFVGGMSEDVGDVVGADMDLDAVIVSLDGIWVIAPSGSKQWAYPSPDSWHMSGIPSWFRSYRLRTTGLAKAAEIKSNSKCILDTELNYDIYQVNLK